jgi:hypothetical protein
MFHRMFHKLGFRKRQIGSNSWDLQNAKYTVRRFCYYKSLSINELRFC